MNVDTNNDVLRELAEELKAISESLCEMEVQANNAARAQSLGGLDIDTVQRMFCLLAASLYIEQKHISMVIDRVQALSDSLRLQGGAE